jgi:hypothetical protein
MADPEDATFDEHPRDSARLVALARGRSGSRRRRVLVAGAVVVLVVLGATAAVLLRDDDQQADVTTDSDAGSDTIPRLVPADLPEGLPPSGAMELPLPDQSDAGTTPVSVYGDPSADDPFADADLGLFVRHVDDLSMDEPSATVRGQPAEVDATATYGTSLTWEEEPGVAITAASLGLNRDQLLAVTEGLAVEDGAASVGTVPADVPGPLQLVAATEMSAVVSPPIPAAAVGHMVAYQDPEGDRAIAVTALGADATDLAVVRWMAGATTATDVRGHQGWTSSRQIEDTSAEAGSADVGSAAGEGAASGPAATDSPFHTLIWEESPGVVLVVQGFDVAPDDIRAVAESLRPASDEEWERLVQLGGSDDDASGTATETGTATATEEATATTGGGSPSGPGADVPGDALVTLQGGYAEGEWAVYVDADGSLCAVSETGSNGSESCSSQPERAAVLTDGSEEGAPVLVYGIRPAGTTGHTITGTQVTGPSQSTTAPDGRTIYAIVVYGGPVPTEIGFIGEDGRVVETAPVQP